MPQATAPGAQPRAPVVPATTRTQDMPLASLQMAVRNVRRDAPPATPPDTANRAEGDATAQSPAAKFEIVFSTGAPVKRYDWANGRYYMEQLEVSDTAVDLSRLERGVPLLNSHNNWDLEDQLGVCDQPEIRGGVGVCQSQLSRRESVKGVVQDLEDGVIRNVSVGYSRGAVEMVAPSEEAGMWVYRVTRWTPMEVSLVPIPADMDSQVVRSEGGTFKAPDGREIRAFPCEMTEIVIRNAPSTPTDTPPHTRTQPAAPAAAPQTTTAVAPAEDTFSTRNSESTTMNPEEIAAAAAAAAATRAAAEASHQAGMQAERTRTTDIRAAVQAARSTLGTEADALATRLIDAGVTVDQARAQVLDALAEASKAQSVRGATHVATVHDEQDTLRTRMSDALVLRNNPNATEFAGTKIDVAGARNFRGMDLMDMARRSIAAAGGNADGLTRRQVAMAALNLDADSRRDAGMLSTSDFPSILASTVNRSLRAAYEQAPRTFTGWARQSTNKDFREKSLLQLSGMSQFSKVNEGGEYKLATFSDTAEKYSLSKYGAIIAITWEALINDDLSAFSRIPMMIAEEAAALEGDIVYTCLTGMSPQGVAVPQIMADGVALFHATHANLAGTAGAISDVTLGAARAAMRKQMGANGRVLNLAPEILIVGPDKEAEALKYTSANFVAAKSVDINPAFNTSLSVIVDNRVTGNQWFLASTPARVDTVEYAYLEGENGLFTTRREGFEVDGVEIKARHVFAAKAIDHRGLYRNAGA